MTVRAAKLFAGRFGDPTGAVVVREAAVPAFENHLRGLSEGLPKRMLVVGTPEAAGVTEVVA